MFALLAMALALVMDVAYAVYAGFILAMMWGWFIVPTFDVSGLTHVVGAGIIMMAALLKMKVSLSDSDESLGDIITEGLKVLAYKVLTATVFWSVAWILLQIV